MKYILTCFINCQQPLRFLFPADVLRFTKLYSDWLKTPGTERQSLFQFIAKMVGAEWEEPYLAQDTSSQDFNPDDSWETEMDVQQDGDQ